MSVRHLSLHPSALSDAEYTLFTVSLGDLLDLDSNDSGIDWEHLSLSVREARAWLCGRYASLGSATVDEILRLFPAPTLSGSAFFAALRLVLHAHAGRGVDRSLAFVQAPAPAVPIANPTTHNPFLPTPEPSPEFHSHKPILRVPASSSTVRRSPSSTINWKSASNTSSPSASSSPSRRTHGQGPASPPLPMHPLRRASTQCEAASSPVLARNANTTLTVNTTVKRTPSNPFRKPPLPPRRASTSTAPTSSRSATSEASPTAQFAVATDSYVDKHARAPPTRGALFPPSPAAPSPHAFHNNRTFNLNAASAGAFTGHGWERTEPYPSPFDVNVQPATPISPYSPFDASAPYYPQTAPPVHPQRRASASEGEDTSTSPSRFAYNAPPPSTRSSVGSSVSSSTSSTSNSRSHSHDGGRGGALPLTLPKAVRRTLGGAGWIGAQPTEREGLVQSEGEGSEREKGVYTARNARRGET